MEEVNVEEVRTPVPSRIETVSPQIVRRREIEFTIAIEITATEIGALAVLKAVFAPNETVRLAAFRSHSLPSVLQNTQKT